jgi:formate--tetrahydrofolate ligase
MIFHGRFRKKLKRSVLKSDDPCKNGRPRDFCVKIREIELSSGAGFIVPVAGTIMRMPGLPANPASENIDIDKNGVITGLF